MKIERKDRKNYMTFEEVRRGDFFEWKDAVFLKINNCDSINAYDCKANSMTSFGAEAIVTLLKAKVVIE